ncbi:hypothetical protein EVAR_57364_1 [Eumeta japonica]|uniref:Uncharacterized protein n=1 Tax=Eumeta variegata TaxID=151549 RepID=A0A4C1ZGH3_EUMVA|nr:hypothetical protein EVAR_57364_1 [Eumeta japonica]
MLLKEGAFFGKPNTEIRERRPTAMLKARSPLSRWKHSDWVHYAKSSPGDLIQWWSSTGAGRQIPCRKRE